MSLRRRDFLKLAGAGALAGLGGASLIGRLGRGDLAEAAHIFKPDQSALTGSRWGMVIDMQKVRGPRHRRKIIDACHKVHNVPDMENKKQEVKWIWDDKYQHVFPSRSLQRLDRRHKDMPFLLLCNHCDNPPCTQVCPTRATFKRPDGIVIMDFHRCIGCRFCMAACPYGSRNFNWVDPRPYIDDYNPEFPTRTKGVVEKCNFCAERLAHGLGPACVEASEGALVFGDLADPDSEPNRIIDNRYTIVRKPSLGTHPSVYYLI